MAEQDEPPRRPRTAIEQLTGRPAKEPLTAEDGVRESFSFSRVSNEDDLMLDVRLRDGSRYAFPCPSGKRA